MQKNAPDWGVFLFHNHHRLNYRDLTEIKKFSPVLSILVILKTLANPD
jgi:hypothetical protein